MPIQNREDAVEVEDRINRIFAATPGQRAAEVRGLFSEVLDFNPASGQASLVSVQAGVSLPDAADRIAELDGDSRSVHGHATCPTRTGCGRPK